MMKRIIGVTAIVTVAALTAACGDPTEEARDVLFLRAGGGVTIVEAGAAAPSFQAENALPTPDWSSIVRTERETGRTEIVAIEPDTGIEWWSQRAEGKLGVKAVSADGAMAVLEPLNRWYGYSPTFTRFVIVRRDGSEPQTIELDGNFAAEAFSVDGGSLFVVQYFPARNPNRYQVRRLDLASGEVLDVYSVDAELQQAMRGTARIQTMSPDGTRLYTLYSLRRSGTSYAFIHVLSLDGELWAHCIDLPAEFATSPEGTTALALSPDARRLLVANTRADVVAEVDTGALEVVRTAPVDLEAGDEAHAVSGPDGNLYVAGGWKVVEVDTAALEARRSWSLPYEVGGLQVGTGTNLYVGQGQELAVIDLDAPDGRDVLDALDPPGIETIGDLGKVTRGLDPVRTEIVCAC